MHFDELADRLRGMSNKELGNGVADVEIVNAEKALGVPIRGALRDFLREFGWANPKTIGLYGLGTGVPPHLDLVRMTISERTEMEPNLPHQLLPLMNDGYGNHYCLDVSGSGEPKVVFWDHEAGPDQKPDSCFGDYLSWLKAMLDEEDGADL